MFVSHEQNVLLIYICRREFWRPCIWLDTSVKEEKLFLWLFRSYLGRKYCYLDVLFRTGKGNNQKKNNDETIKCEHQEMNVILFRQKILGMILTIYRRINIKKKKSHSNVFDIFNFSISLSTKCSARRFSVHQANNPIVPFERHLQIERFKGKNEYVLTLNYYQNI